MDKSKCVTSGMSVCLTAANQQWEAEIDKYYKLLMDALPGEYRGALEKSQAAWVKFKDLESEAIPSI
ncbi:MAG: lysozyme inhibitor LprI family protein, partial [Candidatus Babeliales bacterium]